MNIRKHITTAIHDNAFPFTLLVLLHALDNLLTWRGIVNGFTEKNELLQFADNNIIILTIIGWLALILFSFLLCLIPRIWKITNTHILWVFNIFYALIIGGNMNALSLHNQGLINPF
ncbi:hypothetical protein LCGC14_1119410 [marine sediment metagenome]|uniref:Uncharacterized protein n=1 Tax=marine sediment metagenome TaxID=412755 RepID=A0A0F9QA92_9ZZZZ